MHIKSRIVMYCMAAAFALAAFPQVTIAAVSETTLPKAPPASRPKQEPAKPKPADTSRVNGIVYCSEYGTRYKEPLTLVFVGVGGRIPAEINQDDGKFAAELPKGGSYTMRIEFAGNGFEVGKLEIPADSPRGTVKFLEIFQPGSMLELVWEARAGDSGGGTDFKVKDVSTKEGAQDAPPEPR